MVATPGLGEPSFNHGVSNFAALKYTEGFPHFDYVNPEAPKGGTLVLPTAQNFDSFTPIIGKGIRPPGAHVIELAMLYDPLFWPSDDEPGSFYGNLVEALRSRTLFVGDLPPASGSALARWDAGYGPGR